MSTIIQRPVHFHANLSISPSLIRSIAASTCIPVLVTKRNPSFVQSVEPGLTLLAVTSGRPSTLLSLDLPLAILDQPSPPKARARRFRGRLSSAVQHVASSEDGATFATVTLDSTTLWHVRHAKGRPLAIEAVAACSSVGCAVAAWQSGVLLAQKDGGILILRQDEGDRKLRLQCKLSDSSSGAVTSLKCVRSEEYGRTAIAAYEDGHVRCWAIDLATTPWTAAALESGAFSTHSRCFLIGQTSPMLLAANAIGFEVLRWSATHRSTLHSITSKDRAPYLAAAGSQHLLAIGMSHGFSQLFTG